MATAVRSSEEIMEKVGGLEGHLNCAGHQVYYQIRGEGIPLVFLHDGLLHSTGFNAVMEHLKDDYLLVTYDRPQYGQSPPPSSPVSHTSILDDLLCQMGIAQCVLIGGSAGGSYVAMISASTWSHGVGERFLVTPWKRGSIFGVRIPG